MTGEAFQISPANDPRGSPAKEQQVTGVGIILQITMLVLSFVLGHVLRRHKFYYLLEAGTSLLIGLIVGALANISNTETNIRFQELDPSVTGLGVEAVYRDKKDGDILVPDNVLSEKSCFIWAEFFLVIVRFLETFVGSMSADSSKLQTVEMKMQKSSRSVKEKELAQQAVYSQEKESLLELVEKGKIAARTEKSRQIVSIEGCSRRDENPAVGARKKCNRELFLLNFQDM
ncbi:hypothetical protein KPL71_004440 [Citrus sinensis]|uniref:Uncharacterized protein n=1 Tax=Citrus sinensis TaxID=2711 RepID=A0ACB8N721_CITSI|nr:hypothetical protein KPL71_004440 [Citrus sinensis]